MKKIQKTAAAAPVLTNPRSYQGEKDRPRKVDLANVCSEMAQGGRSPGKVPGKVPLPWW